MLFWGVDSEGNPYGMGAFTDADSHEVHFADYWTSDGDES